MLRIFPKNISPPGGFRTAVLYGILFSDQMLEWLSGFPHPMRLNTSLMHTTAADLSCYGPPCRSHGGSIHITNYCFFTRNRHAAGDEIAVIEDDRLAGGTCRNGSRPFKASARIVVRVYFVKEETILTK